MGSFRINVRSLVRKGVQIYGRNHLKLPKFGEQKLTYFLTFFMIEPHVISYQNYYSLRGIASNFPYEKNRLRSPDK